ncbi:MAG: hypothetical protein AB7N76_30185 [Planctomycetota bacterium]
MQLARSLLLLAPLLAGCAAPPSPEEVEAWRARQPRAEGDDGPGTLADLDQRRAAAAGEGGVERLLTCRAAAARLAADGEAEALWRAARGEADLVLVLQARGAPREERDLAAASGLEWAERARRAAREPSGALLGQRAWSLGSVTHLQPMFDRDEWAQRVAQAAEEALRREPGQLEAEGTLATLHLRLATLPWIAALFAGDAPEPDLARAEALARDCWAQRASLEHALLLAKVLAARDRADEGRTLLRAALDRPDASPRDPALRPLARAYLSD